jgi:hypothetical protein
VSAFRSGVVSLGTKEPVMPKPMRQFPATASLGILLALLVVSRHDPPTGRGEGCEDVLNICGVYSPTWSPEGQRVAFAYWEGYVMSSGVAIINVDGTLRFRRDEDAGAAT